jgi:hypothetical protein
MSQLKIFTKNKASDLIAMLVCNFGTKVASCEHCGRVHYDSTGEFMEEGELEGLNLKAEKEPEKYIGHDGSICIGDLMGKQIVVDCPCNFLGWFEATIWINRELISEYLIKKSEEKLKEAEKMMDSASKTAIVKEV